MWAALLMVCAALAGAPTVDLGQSVVVADTPRLAMGGAGLAVAAGSAGLALTPAAPEHRPSHRRESLVWDLHARAARFGWIGSDNNNLGDDHDLWVAGTWAAGIGLSSPKAGVGLLARGFTSYGLPTADTPWAERSRVYRMDVGDLRPGGAWRVGRSPITVGSGVTATAGRLGGIDELRFLAMGVSFGALLDFQAVGLHFAGVVESSQRDGNVGQASGVESVEVPARGAVGVAWASEALPTPLDRHPLLLAADLELSSAVHNGVEPQAWMAGVNRTSGAHATASPRFGAEIEAVPDALRLRAGTYRDPGRASDAELRWHVTGGVELKLFHIRLRGERIPLAIRNGFDLSQRYAQVQLLGLTFWRPYRVAMAPAG